MQISERSQYEYTVEFSILEIYNEEIKDLLDPKPGKKLEVRCQNSAVEPFTLDITLSKKLEFGLKNLATL